MSFFKKSNLVSKKIKIFMIGSFLFSLLMFYQNCSPPQNSVDTANPATSGNTSNIGGGGTGTRSGIVMPTPESGTMGIQSPVTGQTYNNTSNCNKTLCSYSPMITSIRWSGAVGNSVTIDLYRSNNVKVKTIAQTANNGIYDWVYDPSLANGDYRILIATPSGSQVSGLFSITSITSAVPVSLPIGATTTIVDKDIAGNILITPTKPAGTVCSDPFGGNPGQGPCGGKEIAVSSSAHNCSSGMGGANAIVKAWQYNLEDNLLSRKGNSMRFSLKRNHAAVFRFKTGQFGDFPSLPYPLQFSFDEHTANGPVSTPFITMSEKKCDFDYSKMYVQGQPITDNINNCFQGQVYTGALLSRITATGNEQMQGNVAKHLPYCQLKPNTYYYVNIRWEQALNPAARGSISCPTGINAQDVCGMVLNAN